MISGLTSNIYRYSPNIRSGIATHMRGKLGFREHLKSPSKFLVPVLVSCSFVFLSQFALATVPRFFISSSFLTLLSISAFVSLIFTAVARCFRRILRVSASAPAFVFFNILFVWGFYIGVIRTAVPSLLAVIFNVECILLVTGLYSILSGDPGYVTNDDAHLEGEGMSPFPKVKPQSEESSLFTRVRYCKSCKASIQGFDHHCPAFGNCIGQKNHRLFIFLLLGFVITEISYVMCSTQYITKSQKDKTRLECTFSGNLAISTMLFSILQVSWQVIFLIWHIYCVCLNIKTDEWINWKEYPEFQLVELSQPEFPFEGVRFKNPYNMGILNNIMEFLQLRQ